MFLRAVTRMSLGWPSSGERWNSKRTRLAETIDDRFLSERYIEVPAGSHWGWRHKHFGSPSARQMDHRQHFGRFSESRSFSCWCGCPSNWWSLAPFASTYYFSPNRPPRLERAWSTNQDVLLFLRFKNVFVFEGIWHVIIMEILEQ